MSFSVSLNNDLSALNKLDPQVSSVSIDARTDQLTPAAKRSWIKNFFCRFIYKITCGRFKRNSDLDKVTRRVLNQLEGLDFNKAVSIEEKKLLVNAIGKLITIISENCGSGKTKLQNTLKTTIKKIQTLDEVKKIKEPKPKEIKEELKARLPKDPQKDQNYFMKLPIPIQVEVLKYLNEKEQGFVEEAFELNLQKDPFLLAYNIEELPWGLSKEDFFQHLKECGHLLKELSLNLSFDLDDENLNQIISACPNLEKLSIPYNKNLSNLGLSNISKLHLLQFLRLEGADNKTLEIIALLKNLKSLVLSETSIDSIEKIGDLKNLQSLKLQSNFNGTGLENLKKLKYLDLSHCKSITDENWKKIGLLENLKSLSLSGTHFNDLKILANLKNLQSLDLSFNLKINADNIKIIAGLQNLKHLILQSCQSITDKDLEEIDLLDKLETLKISNCKKVTGTCLKNMKGLKHLKILHLWNTDFNDDSLESLNFFQDLEELALNGCKNVSGQSFKKIANLKKLQRLSLSRTNISSLGLEGLANFPNLKNLDLEDCQNLKDDDLKIIAKFINLQELNLAGTGISEDSLNNLLNLENLKKLKLYSCHNIKSSKQIKFPKNLEELDVSSCKNIKDFNNLQFPEKLQILSLQFSEIVDADLIKISQLKKLQKIYLNKSKITNQGLKKFKELTQNRVDILPPT